MRGNNEKLLLAQKSVLLPQAEAAMRSALGYKGDERFSVVTGVPFPTREIGQDGEVTSENLQARLNVLRSDVKARITNARGKGIGIPKFDPQTGEAIPEDSLRSLREVIKQENSERPWSPPSQEAKEDMEGVDFALEAYRKYKLMKGGLNK